MNNANRISRDQARHRAPRREQRDRDGDLHAREHRDERGQAAIFADDGRHLLARRVAGAELRDSRDEQHRREHHAGRERATDASTKRQLSKRPYPPR